MKPNLEDNPEILIDAAALQARIKELAANMQANGLPDSLMLIALLKGGFMFAGDLFKELGLLGLSPRIDFMRLSSYGKAKTSSGEVILAGPTPDVQGQDVLLVDDILDTGRSLLFANEFFGDKGAKSITNCVLLDKPERRMVKMEADYVGFNVPDRFIVGYGIDYAEKYRYLPHIAAID